MAEVDEVLSALMRSGEMTLHILQGGVRIGAETVALVRKLYERRANGAQVAARENLDAQQGGQSFWLPRDELENFRSMAQRMGLTVCVLGTPDKRRARVVVGPKDLRAFYRVCDLAGIRESSEPPGGTVRPVPSPDDPAPAPNDRSYADGQETGVISGANENERYLALTVPADVAASFMSRAAREDLMVASGAEEGCPLDCLEEGEMLRETLLDAISPPRDERRSGTLLRFLRFQEAKFDKDLRYARLSADQCASIRGKEPMRAPHAVVGMGKHVFVVFPGKDVQAARDWLPAGTSTSRLVSKKDLEARLSRVFGGSDLRVVIPEGEKERAARILQECGADPVPAMEPCAAATQFREDLDHRISRVTAQPKNEHGAREMVFELPIDKARQFTLMAARNGLSIARRNIPGGMRFEPDPEQAQLAGRLLEGMGLGGFLREGAVR